MVTKRRMSREWMAEDAMWGRWKRREIAAANVTVTAEDATEVEAVAATVDVVAGDADTEDDMVDSGVCSQRRDTSVSSCGDLQMYRRCSRSCVSLRVFQSCARAAVNCP
jgi:hypothetical protein